MRTTCVFSGTAYTIHPGSQHHWLVDHKCCNKPYNTFHCAFFALSGRSFGVYEPQKQGKIPILQRALLTLCLQSSHPMVHYWSYPTLSYPCCRPQSGPGFGARRECCARGSWYRNAVPTTPPTPRCERTSPWPAPRRTSGAFAVEYKRSIRQTDRQTPAHPPLPCTETPHQGGGTDSSLACASTCIRTLKEQTKKRRPSGQQILASQSWVCMPRSIKQHTPTKGSNPFGY
jgi:hypothetical protein